MPTCRYAGLDQPRILPRRHADDCADQYDDADGCDGCLPCPESHCRRCFREHAAGACASCLADVRETLAEIGRMCDDLPAEVEVKGIESEAFNLLAPAADPEALGHMGASVAVGRIPAEWLEVADNDRHPLIVAGGWMQVYVEAFDHDEPERITVASALSYLTRNLHEAGDLPDVPFEDMARDLAACRSHMERVLHDGEQVETGAPCMDCSRPLVRVWGDDQHADGWMCHRCRVRRSEAEYRLNVRAKHDKEQERLRAERIADPDATWLTDDEMAERFGLTAGTVRQWATRELIQRRKDSDRVRYRVADVAQRVAGKPA